MKTQTVERTAIGGVIFFAAAWLTAAAAYITSIVACAKAGAWLALLATGLIFPAGVIHGWMIWFGHPWV